jgi:hypothetical protein
MEKERNDERKPREPARPAEPTLELPLHRCPFCHESVGVDDGAWVGCAKCLAVCGACRHAQRLVPERAPPTAKRSWRRPLAFLAAGVAALGLLGATVLALMVQDRHAQMLAAEGRNWDASVEQRRVWEAARAAERRTWAEQHARATGSEAGRAGIEGPTLELVVAGAPPGNVLWTISLQAGPPGLELRRSGQLYDGRGLAKGYARRGPAYLDLEWQVAGERRRRVWLVDLAGDRFELTFPRDEPVRSGIRGKVVPGHTRVMAFGQGRSVGAEVAADGTFELPHLTPGRYSIVACSGDVPLADGEGGLVVEVGPAGLDLTAPVGPARR